MRALSASLTSPRSWRWTAAALLMCVCCLVQAQDQGPDDNGAGDPPSRVARLSYRTGDVGLLPAGEKDWGDASLNRPLTTGDRLSTGPNARAELELGGGNLRIADDSDFGFLTLNDQVAQVEVTKGTLNLAVRGLAEGQSYEIDTPTVALVVNQPGTFRVDISDDGKSTRVEAFDGHAVVYGENGAQRNINSGRSYEFADASLNDVTLTDLDGGDDFDAWCNSRDQRYARPQSDQYVSNEVVGAQDLDHYGNWQSDPDYGQVWYPSNVAADWAPYRDGNWSYIAPWGWTWVDASPWGFAPYHYGRWASVRGRWCWVPGPATVRPVYAPALVAFVGGGGVGVSVGIGGPVGWFPLGPGEIYNPWYHASRGYYTNVNVTNIYVRGGRTVVMNDINHHYDYFRNGRPMPNERYFNREVPHAFTAMSGQDFVASRNAQHHMMAMDPRHFAAAPVLARGVDVRPERASFAPPRAASARPLPTGGFQREVVARTPPAAGFAGRGPAANANGPARPAPGPTNVRMLGDTPAFNRGPAGNRPANMSGPDRAAGFDRNAGAAPAQQRQPVPSDNERAAMRPGELPSARFARPRDDMGGGDRAMPADRAVSSDRQTQGYRPSQGNQPRPGVSYIPSAAEDRAARNQPAPGMLPNTPRFERAPAGQPTPQENARAPVNQDNGPRFQRENEAPRPQAMEPRNMPQQRSFEPQGGNPQPQRGYEPPQRSYEPPRGNPNPQPQQQRQQNSGQQSQSHEDRHPPHKDDQHN